MVFCLCIDMAGVYFLSSNWNHRLEVPATCLQTSQFPIKKGEGAISCSMRKLGLEKTGNLPKVIAGKFETCSGAPKHCHSEIHKSPSEEGVLTLWYTGGNSLREAQ